MNKKYKLFNLEEETNYLATINFGYELLSETNSINSIILSEEDKIEKESRSFTDKTMNLVRKIKTWIKDIKKALIDFIKRFKKETSVTLESISKWTNNNIVAIKLAGPTFVMKRSDISRYGSFLPGLKSTVIPNIKSITRDLENNNSDQNEDIKKILEARKTDKKARKKFIVKGKTSDVIDNCTNGKEVIKIFTKKISKIQELLNELDAQLKGNNSEVSFQVLKEKQSDIIEELGMLRVQKTICYGLIIDSYKICKSLAGSGKRKPSDKVKY